MNYSLRKGSRKELCPSCGKRSFKPYVDEDGQILSDIVGRCDREHKCRYHLAPSQYLKERDISLPGHAARPFRASPRVWTPPAFIDRADFTPTIQNRYTNSLATYLHNIFDAELGAGTVDLTLSRMGVGTSAKFGGSPVFWLIDSDGHIRDGKVMAYDHVSGKRVKKPYPLFTNIHSLLKHKYSGDFRPCFFGEHLVSLDNSGLPVWLFESEKAALITALAMECGGMWLGLPMASGGCSTFNPTDDNKCDPWGRLRVLRGRRVVLFPDEGKFEEWSLKGRALRGFSSEVYISTAMEKKRHPVKVKCDIGTGDGFDDLLLRYRRLSIDTAPLLLTAYGHRSTYRLA